MPHHLSTFSSQFSPPPARHYHPTLSIWLSVDPMSDKYPSTSPYTYCGNNPVRLVDPDGRTIIIEDEDNGTGMADAGFKDMQKGTNLTLSKDKNGVISAYGEPITDVDYQLLEAINNNSVEVHIICARENQHNQLGGSFMGSTYNYDGTALSTNLVGIFQMRKTEEKNKAPAGSGIIHEATEGFAAGLLSINNKMDISAPVLKKTETPMSIGCTRYGNTTYSITTVDYVPENPQQHSWFMKAHYAATTAPNEMNNYTRLIYNAPSTRTIKSWFNKTMLHHGK